MAPSRTPIRLSHRSLGAAGSSADNTATAFDQGGQLHETLQEVLARLGPINAWRIAAWFNGATRTLGGRAPRELLDSNPQAVLRAAGHYRDYPV